MTSLLYICLLLLGFTSHCFSRDDVFFKKYVSLIFNVHRYYGTSSVFFLFSRNERRLEEYTFVHFLSRDLSQRGVLSLILKLEELDDSTKFYRRRIVRPLTVVLLKTMSDVAEFHKNSRDISSYPIWLMIFAGETGNPLCEYCAHPMGNNLHLRFDTEMVVSCCDDPMMKEWWSAYKNRTEVANFATWTENEELLTVLVLDGVYARRHDVKGAGLRIAYVANTGVKGKVKKAARSFFGSVLMELRRTINFTISEAVPVEATGSFNPVTNNWTGAIGQLTQGQIDIGIGEFSMTNSRLDVIDFTFPLLLSRTRLYIKQPDGSGVQWSAYFQAFTFEIWMTIIFLLITSSILLTIIAIKGTNVPSLYLFLENYLCVWGLFCQQGLFKFPVETPMRIASFSILVSALVVFTAYSASLTSYLTVYSPTLPFVDLPGFVNDGSYKLIVIQRSSNYDFFVISLIHQISSLQNSDNDLMRRMSKMMKPWDDLPKTYKEGFRQICEERVAFYTVSAVRKIMNKHIKCNIVSIETERTDSLALAISVDNQYTGVVNYHLQRLKDNGMMHRLKNENVNAENPPETTYDVVTLCGVAPILTVVAGGIILSAVIMIFEIIYVSVKTCIQRQEHTTKS